MWALLPDFPALRRLFGVDFGDSFGERKQMKCDNISSQLLNKWSLRKEIYQKHVKIYQKTCKNLTVINARDSFMGEHGYSI